VILVDSSVWIDHFRKPSTRLARLLYDENVLVHSMVIGELACGNFQALPQARKADDEEILFFIEHHRLYGQGVGLMDAHLLASCFMESCFLWTADKRLKATARRLRVDVGQQL